MSELLKLEIQTICIVHIIAILISLIFFMMFYIKANKEYSVKAFLVMQISMIGWMVFKIFKTVSPTSIARWWFIVAYYVCACVLEVAFLEFGYAYYKGRPIHKKIRFLIYVIPFIQIVAVTTNPFHHLFYATYDFYGDTFGILFYMHTLIEYIFIAVGFIYCYKTFKLRFIKKKFAYKIFISMAILVPAILNFLYITRGLERFVEFLGIQIIFDITPIVFTWSTLIFIYATFRHDFLSLSPIMKHEIVDKLDTPICVLDSSCDVIYVNEKLNNLLDQNASQVIKKLLIKDIVKMYKNEKKEITVSDLTFKVFIKEVFSIRETQYLVIFRDITVYRRIEKEIKENQVTIENTNQALKTAISTLTETSKIGARNYVARELHDTIGHSLVIAIKLLEVAKLYKNKDQKQSVRALEDASASIEDGIKEMNQICMQGEEDAFLTGKQLKKELEKMLGNVNSAGIKTSIHFEGIYNKVDEKIFSTIKKVCKELTTNSLKHSKATEILISIVIKNNTLALLVMDNGVGCHTMIKGNGLKGIEERILKIGGSVHFVSAIGEGFVSKILIKQNQ